MSRETQEQNTVEKLLEDLEIFLIDHELDDVCQDLNYKFADPRAYFSYCKLDGEFPLWNYIDEIQDEVIKAWEESEGTCTDIRELLIKAYK